MNREGWASVLWIASRHLSTHRRTLTMTPLVPNQPASRRAAEEAYAAGAIVVAAAAARVAALAITAADWSDRAVVALYVALDRALDEAGPEGAANVAYRDGARAVHDAIFGVVKAFEKEAEG